MTNVKWLRQALLGGAALGVLTAGAQADELSALKAQLEALQSRVDQMEQTAPAPALPAGTKLLTLRKGQGSSGMIAPLPARDRLQAHQGYTIAVTPTADMPAPVSEVTVTGEIRARLLYQDFDVDGSIDLNANTTSDDDATELDDFDITSRGRLRIDGRTETAIGEVGGTIRLQGTDGDDVTMNIAWGYWQMTPNLQFGGGYWDSLAAIQAGWDWNGEPSLIGLDSGPTNQSISQFRLSYSSGGLTLAGSLEDNPVGDLPAIAGAIIFDSGSFLVTAAGIWEEEDDDGTFVDTDDNWFVGVGAIIRLSDMFRLEGAAGMGEGYTGGNYVASLCSTDTIPDDCENDYEYWGANVLAVVSFAEEMRVELGFAYSDVDHEKDDLAWADDFADAVHHSWTVGASLFWDPVDQLTLGWGVGFTHKDDNEDDEYDSINAGFGAWFRF